MVVCVKSDDFIQSTFTNVLMLCKSECLLSFDVHQDDEEANKESSDKDAGSVAQTENSIEDIQSRPICVKTLCEFEGVCMRNFPL
jgi:hypothetical protein